MYFHAVDDSFVRATGLNGHNSPRIFPTSPSRSRLGLSETPALLTPPFFVTPFLEERQRGFCCHWCHLSRERWNLRGIGEILKGTGG